MCVYLRHTVVAVLCVYGTMGAETSDCRESAAALAAPASHSGGGSGASGNTIGGAGSGGTAAPAPPAAVVVDPAAGAMTTIEGSHAEGKSGDGPAFHLSRPLAPMTAERREQVILENLRINKWRVMTKDFEVFRRCGGV